MKKAGYLRTNWRETGVDLPVDAVGAGIPKGSALGGAGYALPHGGLIFQYLNLVGSNTAAGQAVATIGADSILASVFGVGHAPGQGYKIKPMQVFPRALSATAGGDTSVLNLYGSITLSDDSTIRWYVQIASLTADNLASYFSCKWYWTGFILSVP